jgi:hypothetical protein
VLNCLPPDQQLGAHQDGKQINIAAEPIQNTIARFDKSCWRWSNEALLLLGFSDGPILLLYVQ